MQQGKIIGLYEFGISIQEIAKRYNKTEKEIEEIICSFQENQK